MALSYGWAFLDAALIFDACVVSMSLHSQPTCILHTRIRFGWIAALGTGAGRLDEEASGSIGYAEKSRLGD